MTRLLGLCTAAAAPTRGGEDTLVLLAFPVFLCSCYGSYACLFLSSRMRDLGKGLRSLVFLSVSGFQLYLLILALWINYESKSVQEINIVHLEICSYMNRIFYFVNNYVSLSDEICLVFKEEYESYWISLVLWFNVEVLFFQWSGGLQSGPSGETSQMAVRLSNPLTDKTMKTMNLVTMRS